MKEGWKEVKLGEIATFTRGLTYSKHDEVDFSTNIVLRSNNVNLSDGKINLDELKYLSDTFLIPLDKKVKKGALLMCMSNGSKAHLGKVALIEEDFDYAFGGFMGLVTHNELLDDKFFWYSLTTPAYKKYISHLSEGANINNIKVKDLQAYTIPLPPLSEQQRIVEYLDSTFAEIDALKAKAAEEVANSKAMFDAALREEMTPKENTPMKQIGEIFKSYSGGTPIKSNKVYYENGNIPWLRSGEVCQKYINETEMFITEAGLKNSSAKYYPVNTVVIAMYGATAAQVGILKIEATSNQAVCGLLPNDSYSPEYVYYWFSAIQKDLAAQAQGGAQPNISQEKIKKVLIPIMNIAEQHSIVARLDTLRTLVTSLEQNYTKIATECDALKQAILRETFE